MEEKSFYASYLNMAVCNIVNVFYHLNAVFYPVLQNEADKHTTVKDTINSLENLNIIKELILGTDTTKQQKIIGQFEKYIPFFKLLFSSYPLKNKKPSEKTLIICSYIELVLNLRDFYTYAKHKRISIFERNKLLEEDLCVVFDSNIRTVKERFMLDEREVMHLRRRIGKSYNNNFKYDFIDSKNHKFKTEGLLFLICQFLEKKYALLMLKQQNTLNESREKWGRATLYTYTIQCLMLPRVRLNSEEKEITLGMDIANELYKCPKELYDLLDKKDKEKFRVKADTEQDTDDGTEILKKRSKDRFPYFALRYLDIKKCFSNIFFQVDMGNYFFDVYGKKLIDGTTINDRRLSKRILVFDKIQDTEKEFFLSKEKDNNLYAAKKEGKKEYRNETFPHYHINNNQVGIKLNTFYPHLNGKKTISEHPDCWLSTYELPIIVYLCLQGKQKDVEDKIKNHIEYSRSFFEHAAKDDFVLPDAEQFKRDFHLDISDIPEVFRKPQKNHRLLASQAVFDMIEKTKRMLRTFENENNYNFKLGKESKPRFSSGRVADLLVEDFLRFQACDPAKEGGGKITAPNYQALQAAFAYYRCKKNTIYDTLNNAGLLKGNYRHPFLSQCIPLPETGGDFFKTYLKAKITYLEGIQKNKNYDVYFLRAYTKKTGQDLQSEQQQAAQNLLSLPVNLPRGLFASLFPNLNGNTPSYFILQELKQKKDSEQNFYSYKRNYPILQSFGLNYMKLPCISDIKKKMRAQKDVKMQKQFYIFEQSEKLLRFIKTCDIISFYMVKDLLEITDDTIKMNLTSVDDNFILNQTQAVSALFKVDKNEYSVKGMMKIKNYGNFKRILSDKRLKTFFQYLDSDHCIDYKDLEKEFKTYDTLRLQIYNLIHQFEETVINRYELEIPANKNRIDFKDILKSISLPEPEKALLKEIRYAFFHHQYPKNVSIPLGLVTEQIGVLSTEKFNNAIKIYKGGGTTA